MNNLNQTYREQGWGLVTDKALRINPEDVESAARTVAQWAYDRISNLEKVLAAMLSDVESMQSAYDTAVFGGFSEFCDDGETGSIEWPNLAISAGEARKVLDRNQLDPKTGPFWHEQNPWKDKLVYVTLSEINEIINYEPNWREYDYRLDAYLLPSPDPEYFSAGVRYGPNGPDYISLHIDQMKAQALYGKATARSAA